MWSQAVHDPFAKAAAAGLYVLQRSTEASITSGKRFCYENTSRLRWLPPVQTLPGLPEGGGVAGREQGGGGQQGPKNMGTLAGEEGGRGGSLGQGG